MKHLRSLEKPVVVKRSGYRTLARSLRYWGTGILALSLTVSASLAARAFTDDAGAARSAQSNVFTEVSDQNLSVEQHTVVSTNRVTPEPLEGETPEEKGGQSLGASIAGDDNVDTATRDVTNVGEISSPVEPAVQGLRRASSPFRSAVSTPFVCNKNWIYSQNSNGEIRAFDPETGQEGDIVAPAAAVAPPTPNPIPPASYYRTGSMNATGIAPDGSYAIAIENLSFQVYKDGKHRGLAYYRFWKYTQTEGWQHLFVDGSTDSRERPPGATFVAGAISKLTGDYYYGHYARRPGNTGPVLFKLYRLRKDSNTSEALGTVVADWPEAQAETFNGDMAFDSQGNLFILASHGNADPVATFVVKKAELDAANGGEIPGQLGGGGKVGVKTANGMAFRADGALYIGSSAEGQLGIASHDPFDFVKVGTQPHYLDDKGAGRVDLASCDAPLSMVIEKNVAGRKDHNDQFSLSFTRIEPETQVKPFVTTTTGNANGIQKESLGPTPVVSGQIYRVTEELVGSGNLPQKYTATWQCRTQSAEIASGTGSDFTVDPGKARGEQITCTITNTPTGSITWEKRSDDPAKTLLAGSEWQLTSTLADFSPLTIKDCVAEGQCDGTHDHDPRPGYLKVDYLKDATYTLLETKAPQGHNLDKESRTFVVGDTKRDHAAGAITNPRLRSSIIVKKTTFTEDGTTREDTARGLWTIGASLPAGTAQGITLKSNEQNIAEQQTGSNGLVMSPWDIFFTNATQNASLTLSETLKDGWDAKQLVCVNAETNAQIANIDLSKVTPVNGKVSATISGLRPGINAICDFHNARIPGTLKWTKVDAADGQTILSGSEWILQYPDGTTVSLTDCVSETQCPNNSLDRDKVAGQFFMDKLPYGKYTLTETKAPAGFALPQQPSQTFTITATQRDVVLDPVHNERRPGVAIPLTGGSAADTYLITGGALMGLSMAAALLIMRKRRQTTGA